MAAVRLARIFHLVCWLALSGAALSAHAAGPHGVDVGWTVDHSSGQILFTSTLASQLAQGETGWVRVEMSLVQGHSTWDATMLAYYDTVVNNALGAGIQVIMLIDGGSWPGSQTDWCANNSENNHGANGDNLYVEGFATNAVAPLIEHFHDRVKVYELWNEPNCWSSSPSTGVYVGCTYIYPSNFGWLLARSWTAVHVTQGLSDVTLVSGGVFGHNIGGVSSYANAGAQYLDDTYSTGTNLQKGAAFYYSRTNANAYPLDGVGQHIYLSQGGTVSSNTFRQYEDWVHQALTKYEGASTPKKSFITEFGWQTTNTANQDGVSQAVQDTNLNTAFGAIKATPYLRTAIWFQWKDNPAGSLWYGVLDSSGAAKLAYPDYQRYERFEGVYSNATTNIAIQAYFTSAGQPVLGCPTDTGHTAWVYTNAIGYAQDFAGGSHSNLTVMASTNGTYEINSLHALWSYYFANNGLTAYGAPLDNEFASGGGTRQDFSAGYLSWDPANQVVWHQVLGVPPAPTGLTAAPGNGQVTLQWNGSPGATSYYVKRSTNLNGPFTNVLTSVVGPTLFTDAPLANGTTYFYVVSAHNAYGESLDSNEANATPDINLANLPSPWQQSDVGSVNLNGTAGYSSGLFSLKGAGADIGSTADACQFAWQPLAGDGTILARVKSLQSQTNLEALAKAGVMLRETLAPSAIEVCALLTASNGVHREYRVLTGGGTTDTAGPPDAIPYWLKLTRSGSTFIASASSDGATFVQIASATLTMSNSVLAGLVVCSHNTNALDTAIFDNVAVTPQSAPVVLAATPADGQVSLQWSTVAGAAGYNLRRASVSGGPYAMIAAGLDATNYVDTGLTDAATYYYVLSATNAAGEGPLSVEVAVMPASPPLITAQPQSQVVVQGTGFAFTVTATNAAPLSYQWRLNGFDIAAATGSAYSHANAQPADAGTYVVVVSDSAYVVTSAVAVLSVRPLLGLDSRGVLSWTGDFVLQTATNPAGPYSDITGATSPFTTNLSTFPQQFFRLRN